MNDICPHCGNSASMIEAIEDDRDALRADVKRLKAEKQEAVDAYAAEKATRGKLMQQKHALRAKLEKIERAAEGMAQLPDGCPACLDVMNIIREEKP